MAAGLALPAGGAHRDELVAIVFGATFVTLLTQALPFRRVLHLLGVVVGSDDAFDAARANLIAARRGQAELDSLLATGLLARGDHAERRAAFQRIVIEAEAALRTPEADAADDVVIETVVLTAQKVALADAARRGLVAGDTAERAISGIDRRLLGRGLTEGSEGSVAAEEGKET